MSQKSYNYVMKFRAWEEHTETCTGDMGFRVFILGCSGDLSFAVAWRGLDQVRWKARAQITCAEIFFGVGLQPHFLGSLCTSSASPA